MPRVKAVELLNKLQRANTVSEVFNPPKEDRPPSSSVIKLKAEKVKKELAKSAEMTPKQKRYASYMGIGMAGLPVLGLAANKLRTGKFLAGLPLKKFLPEQMAHGAFWGAMPAAAEEIAAKFPDKTASIPGQDLRAPVFGETKMPTADSTASATKKLQASQGNAEVGPAPSVNTLKPSGPTIQDIAPKSSSSTAGSLPKIGHVMENDPLIKYLRKQASYASTQIENNEDEKLEPDMKAKPIEPGDGQSPEPSPDVTDSSKEWGKTYLDTVFNNTKGIAKKYTAKDYPVGSDLIAKVLK